jgi:hypothetical protein
MQTGPFEIVVLLLSLRSNELKPSIVIFCNLPILLILVARRRMQWPGCHKSARSIKLRTRSATSQTSANPTGLRNDGVRLEGPHLEKNKAKKPDRMTNEYCDSALLTRPFSFFSTWNTVRMP